MNKYVAFASEYAFAQKDYVIFIQVNNVLKYGFLCFLTKIVCLTLQLQR